MMPQTKLERLFSLRTEKEVVSVKLSKQDKILLQRWGHSDTDYEQIEEALKSRCTKYRVCGESISRSEAIKLLGWKVFLSGISRSAFHFTAARPTNDGKTIVHFDSSNMFA